jgi:Zn-dependent alcohol dehydrogenase
MKARAAVAWEAGNPLVIEEIEVDGPKSGEVLLKAIDTNHQKFEMAKSLGASDFVVRNRTARLFKRSSST